MPPTSCGVVVDRLLIDSRHRIVGASRVIKSAHRPSPLQPSRLLCTLLGHHAPAASRGYPVSSDGTSDQYCGMSSSLNVEVPPFVPQSDNH